MFAVLPKGAKPSKSVSTDAVRPHLTQAAVVCEQDGTWVLVATDSYQLARIVLDIREPDAEPELTAGPISLDALKAIEKAGAFTANGTVQAASEHGSPEGPVYPRVEQGRFPNHEQLMPATPEAGNRLILSFNPGLLWRVAQALATNGRQGRIEVEVDLTQTKVSADGTIGYDKPIIVRGTGTNGLLMPVRRP